MFRAIRFSAGLALLGALAACSSASSPGNTALISLNVATRSAGGPVAAGLSALSAGAPIKIGEDSIVLDTVKLVLRKVELEQVESSACSDAPATAASFDEGQNQDGGDSTGSEGENHEADDGCEEVKAGPLLVDLPIGDNVEHTLSATIPAGTYRSVHFQLHQPTDDPADQAFLGLHPEMSGASVRVVGSFNGQPFVFTSDVTISQEIELNPPVAVTDPTTPVELTVHIDLGTWFVSAGGASLVDPSSANPGQPNEELVQENIHNSFQAFEDENHDGEDDSQE